MDQEYVNEGNFFAFTCSDLQDASTTKDPYPFVGVIETLRGQDEPVRSRTDSFDV